MVGGIYMAHDVNEMVLEKFDFTSIEIYGESIEAKYNSIDEAIDAICDARLNALEDKAIRGKAVDIMNYNIAISRDKFNRFDLKAKFREQFNLLNLVKI